jgi:hypothetical protein
MATYMMVLSGVGKVASTGNILGANLPNLAKKKAHDASWKTAGIPRSRPVFSSLKFAAQLVG